MIDLNTQQQIKTAIIDGAIANIQMLRNSDAVARILEKLTVDELTNFQFKYYCESWYTSGYFNSTHVAAIYSNNEPDSDLPPACYSNFKGSFIFGDEIYWQQNCNVHLSKDLIAEATVLTVDQAAIELKRRLQND